MSRRAAASPTELPVELLRTAAAEGGLTLRVRGTSMLPLLADGDRVEIVAPPEAPSLRPRYRPGDVVAFSTASGPILVHRLLGYRRLRGRLAYVLRGDAETVVDSPRHEEDIVGRVRCPVGLGDRLRASAAYFRWLLGAGFASLRRRLGG